MMYICIMTVFVITINGKVGDCVYCSLKKACEEHNLSYDSAIIDKKRVWVDSKNNITVIHEASLEKIKGRGGRRTKGVGKKYGNRPNDADNQGY